MPQHLALFFLNTVSWFFTAAVGIHESSCSGQEVPHDAVKQEPSLPPPPPLPPASAEEPQSQVLSSLRLENQLLRSEVASLNAEMASVIQRAKDLQDGKTPRRHSHPFLSTVFSVCKINAFLPFRIEPDASACG